MKKKLQILSMNRRSTRRVIGNLFLSAAVILIVMSSVSAFHTYLKFSQEQRTLAQVVGIAQIKNSWGATEPYPIVELSGPKNTSLQRSVFSNFSQYELNEFKPGSAIAVRYNPEKPLEVKVDSLASNIMTWIFTWITLLLGVTSLILFSIYSITIAFVSAYARNIRAAKINRRRESSLDLEKEPFV
jgi:hypothetical protein